MSNFAALSKSSQVTSDANENLRLYAMLGDITPVQHAMIQGANIDDADPVEGNTALLEAARSGHTDMVAELLRCAVIDAAKRGHSAVVETLATEKPRAPGAHVDSVNLIGETPMILAARDGDIKMVQTLLRLGGSVDHQERHGTTALMAAADGGHRRIVETLLESKADTNLADDAGHTAMLYASRQGHYGVLRSLMDYGAHAYPHGGRRLFNQPAWGPSALHPSQKSSLTMSLPPGQHMADMMQRIRDSEDSANAGLVKHSLDLRGVRTIHTHGTSYDDGSAGRLTLPSISNKKLGQSLMDQSQSAGDSDYQQAKQRLLQELFGPPQRAKERPKPHKAIDGKAFETLAEMREYEEANFPLCCPHDGCKKRFKHDFELKTHVRSHKPAGFLEEEARSARARGMVDGPWQEIDLGDIYSEMHELRTSILRALEDGVPQETLGHLLVAMGDGHTSDEDKQLLLRYCPDEVPVQKAAMYDMLITYQGHLKVLYLSYAKKPGGKKDEPDIQLLLTDLTQLLKDTNVIRQGFKVSLVDQIFAMIIEGRAGSAAGPTDSVMGKKKKAKDHLTEPEFIAAIVRIAYTKFRRLLCVNDKLLWLLKNHLMEHDDVKIVDDPTVVTMAKRKVKDVFQSYKQELKGTFNRYGLNVGGRTLLSLAQFIGMLKTCGLVDAEGLTLREARFIFMSVANDEDQGIEPETGGRADDSILLPWEGFMNCIARMAREKDRIETRLKLMSRKPHDPIPEKDDDDDGEPMPQKVFEWYIKDEFIPKTQGLDFWQLKKVGLTMKRNTKKKVAKKDEPPPPAGFKAESTDLVAAQQKYGLDVATMLSDDSKARTAIFSAISNISVTPESRMVIIAHLEGYGVEADMLQFVADALTSKGKLKKRAKELLDKYNVPTSPAEESAAIEKALADSDAVLNTIFLFYSHGTVFERAYPLGLLDGPGLQQLCLDCNLLDTHLKKKTTPPAVVAVVAEPAAEGEPEPEVAVEAEVELPLPLRAREYVQDLLDMVKRARHRAELEAAAAAAGPDGVVAPDALPDPTAVIWQWYGDPAGTPADMLQIEEFRPLVARLAQDSMRGVVGGLSTRMLALVSQKFTMHWCVSAVDHPAVHKRHKSKAVTKIVNMHKTNMRKIFKHVCDWDNKTNHRSYDVADLLMFLEVGQATQPILPQPKTKDPAARALQAHALQYDRSVRFLVLEARIKQGDKNMFDLWIKILEIICDLSAGQMFEPPEMIPPPKLSLSTGEDGEEAANVVIDEDGNVTIAAPKTAAAARGPFDQELNTWLQTRVLNVPFNYPKMLAQTRNRAARAIKEKEKAAKKKAAKEKRALAKQMEKQAAEAAEVAEAARELAPGSDPEQPAGSVG